MTTTKTFKTTITKQEAHEILSKYIKTPHIIDHSKESAIIMEHLAKHFDEKEEIWYCIGLLHDLDMDLLEGNYITHGETTQKLLEEEGYNIPELLNPILSHTECLEEMNKKYLRKNKVDFSLGAAEQITGIITAYARMRPNKLDEMQVKSLTKKFKDPSFARNVNREFVNDIEKTGINRNDFFTLAITAIQSIEKEINI